MVDKVKDGAEWTAPDVRLRPGSQASFLTASLGVLLPGILACLHLVLPSNCPEGLFRVSVNLTRDQHLSHILRDSQMLFLAGGHHYT